MLIATKLGRAVTYHDDLPPLVTKLFKHAVPWGHGTNTTIISNMRMSMVSKLVKVVTYREKLPPINTYDSSMR